MASGYKPTARDVGIGSVPTGLPPEPSFFTILSIHPSLLSSTTASFSSPASSSPSELLKKAYRRALLRHHPDKKSSLRSIVSGSTSSSITVLPSYPSIITPNVSSTPPNLKTRQTVIHANDSGKITYPNTKNGSDDHDEGASYSIDQITTAYSVLSHSSSREQYIRSLLLATSSLLYPSLSSENLIDSGVINHHTTGIETLDLDDLVYHETNNDSGIGSVWTRPCRCGNSTGFEVSENDLEDAISSCSNSSYGEILVGCKDCSLWLRVHFAMVDDEYGDGGKGGMGQEDEDKVLKEESP